MMMRALIALLAASLALVAPAWSQQPTQCQVSTSAPTYANGATRPLSCDTSGNLRTDASVSIPGGLDVNLTGINGGAPVTGHGTATGALRIELPTDGTGKVGLNAGTNGIGSLTAGTAAIGSLTAGTAVIGKVGIDAAQTGITPVVSASAEASHVLKASAGSLWGVYATNLTATAGFLVVINATSAPGDGAITPLACVPLTANGVASINYMPGPPAAYSTGITAVVTSASTCFTKTTGVITAFLGGQVQ